MKKLLITDVDNTLFDWQRLWFACFSAMSEKALEISGLDPETFYDECRQLHQLHGTSEYAFVLTELPSFKNLYGDAVLRAMQPAIDAFRDARTRNLVLYPSVDATLTELQQQGITIAAYTESKAFYTNYRFRKLGLDGKISFLYSPPDHDVPARAAEVRRYSPEHYELKETVHRFTPEGEFKPNPDILLTIVEELGFTASEAVYVGDSLLKDVWMAQQAQVTDAYAEYGSAYFRREEYELLKRVTHWTPEMVAREKRTNEQGQVTPSVTLKHSFAEVIAALEF